ncbi:MAG TPA: fused MFS/spermidine synthase [Bryobacteraceae bacterium]|nr:fused MFS/spermidine synthase [Bryobacteraceae bacterium]
MAVAEITPSQVDANPQARPQPGWISILHCATVFASAFLLFSLQPLMGRLILPWFGGSAAVWSACMLFFQACLLAGYAYADWTSRRLNPRTQGWLHAALLAACVLFLPIRLNPSVAAAQAPAARIILILAVSIGAPYLLLSSTSPLIQTWYARARGTAPYRLYALSNLASLLALISYPTLIEPYLTARGQINSWSVGFLIFAALCGTAAFFASRENSPKMNCEARGVPLPTKLLWITLAAIPSALLLATTNHLCQNVAAIPFLWVVPLAAYLLSLILCFDYDSPRRHRCFLWLTPPALAGMAYASLHGIFSTNPRFMVPLFTAGLFIACMTFHGELVHRKPASNQSTSFYLMVALGGAIGGLVIVLVAPALLSGVFELPLLLTASAICLQFLYYRRRWYLDVVWAGTSIAVLVFAMAQIRTFSSGTRVAMRNFYGALRIVDQQTADGSPSRVMVHGTIAHGTQFQDAVRSKQATTYYAPGTGAWFALEALRRGPESVALIGLGAGTLAAYAKPGDHFIFYELNPQVIDLARREFTYVHAPEVEIVEGDGRLALAEDPHVYDVLVLDAFSGDSIPTHLLTREAVQIYLRHLNPDGILAMHISNSVLDLESPVAGLAQNAGLDALLVHTPGDPKIDRSEAIWALMSRDPQRLRHPQLDQIARPIHAQPGRRLWTDDYSNIFQLLKKD